MESHGSRDLAYPYCSVPRTRPRTLQAPTTYLLNESSIPVLWTRQLIADSEGSRDPATNGGSQGIRTLGECFLGIFGGGDTQVGLECDMLGNLGLPGQPRLGPHP